MSRLRPASPDSESDSAASSMSTRVMTPSTLSDDSSVPDRDVPLRSVEADEQAHVRYRSLSSVPSSHVSQIAGVSESTISSTPGSNTPTSTIASQQVNGVGGLLSNLHLSSSSSTSLESVPTSDVPSTPRIQTSDASRGASTSDALDLAGLSAALNSAVGLNSTPQSIARSANNGQAMLLSPMGVASPRQQSISDPATPRQLRHRSTPRSREAPHQVADEEPPEEKFHQPAFQQAFRESKELVSHVKEVLSSSTLHDEPDTTMKKLYQDARTLSKFQCPDTRTVGLVGDSGVGKSSLINSLLDVKGLAKATNSGAACTCVVTEYHYHEEEDFSIVIEWFDKDEIVEQIDELLEVYRHYHLGGLSLEERKELEERAGVARDTFRAMFRDRLRSPEEEDFLLSDSEEEALERLLSWAEARTIAEDVTERWLSLDECSRRLMELTSEPISSSEPAAWPFIKKINVFLNAHILSKGLILVDLPGLRDLNAARRHITERYLLEVDQIFSVCPIGRATTDAGVAAVFELAKAARLKTVGIICTKADDIVPDEALKDWKGRNAAALQGCMDTVEQTKQSVEELKSEIEAYENDLEDLSPEEQRDLLRLRSKADRAEKQLVKHEFELKQFLMTTRNTIVVKELQKIYGNEIPGNVLSVFCASNRDYWEYRSKPKSEGLPGLDLSGVLAIRKHCVAIVAEAKYQAALLYMRHKIPALLSQILLWVESGSGSLTAEKKAAIRNSLDLAENALNTELTSSTSVLRKTPFRELFRTHITNNQRQSRWSEKASSAAYRWSTWHHSTYAAFCRNNGNYLTPAVGSHNWNQEAIEAMVRDMTGHWQRLESGINKWQDLVETAVEVTFEHSIEILNNQLQEANLGSLIELLSHCPRLLLSELDTQFDAANEKIRLLRINALTGIDSAFIGEAMRPAYRNCNTESGRGSDSRRKNIIERRIEDPQLFPSIFSRLRNGYSEILNDCETTMRQTVGNHLAAVRENMAILRDENVALESEKDPAFRTRVEAKTRSVQTRLNQIQAGIAD